MFIYRIIKIIGWFCVFILFEYGFLESFKEISFIWEFDKLIYDLLKVRESFFFNFSRKVLG